MFKYLSLLGLAFAVIFSFNCANAAELLECGYNVDCHDQENTVEAMRYAWLLADRSGDFHASVFSENCYNAMRMVESINEIAYSAGIAQAQLSICNTALQYVP